MAWNSPRRTRVRIRAASLRRSKHCLSSRAISIGCASAIALLTLAENARASSQMSSEVIPSVSLEIRGQVKELIIESSIVGAIRESTSETDPCSAGRIVIRDSIVQSLVPGTAAIETRVAELTLERVTVFGDVSVNRLEATEALIQGTVRVLDNQHGCFRFSTANDTPDKRMPRHYESPLFAPQIPNHFFTSRRFGDPGFAQLSATAPDTCCPWRGEPQ